jgi:hypothetical protein
MQRGMSVVFAYLGVWKFWQESATSANQLAHYISNKSPVNGRDPGYMSTHHSKISMLLLAKAFNLYLRSVV